MNLLPLVLAGLQPLLAVMSSADDRPTTIGEFYETGARTRVIAHRGFSAAAPENTVAAVRAAIEIRADMVEIDVTLTADGRVVVIHDETLDRTTDGSGEVSRFTFAELRNLDAGSWFDPKYRDERIPTLDEVLIEVKSRILLNVEIKSEAVERGIVGEVARTVRRHQMVDQVVVSSFSPDALKEMHAVAPEILTAVLYNATYHEGRDPVEIVNEVGAAVFNIKRQRLTKKMLGRCEEHGIPVGVYTVNTPRRLRRLIKKGVAGIFSDHPNRLIEILASTTSNDPTPTLVPAAAPL